MSTDQRVRYTKMFLQNSLLDILQEKPLARITVTEICKKAELNRTTYYKYYSDPFDQFKQMEEEFLKTIAFYSSVDVADPTSPEGERAVRDLCLAYAENRKTYLTLLSSVGDERFVEKLIEKMKVHVTKQW